MTQTRNNVLAVLALGAVASGCSSRQIPAEELNVIYILADDLGYGDLGCYGQTKIETPNIDRLASEGMLFTRHYAGSSVSAPSRSVLMTGLHTGHTPIRANRGGVGRGDNSEGQAPLPKGTYTLGRMFQQAGYVTGAFGKWGLGSPGSEGDPTLQGFDEFFGYQLSGTCAQILPRVSLAQPRHGLAYGKQPCQSDPVCTGHHSSRGTRLHPK